jgi:hypothetical protein
MEIYVKIVLCTHEKIRKETKMIIRLLGFVLCVVGGFIVTTDLGTMAIGASEATALAMLIGFTKVSGLPQWQAFVMWLMPLFVGMIALCMNVAPVRQPELNRE